MLGQQPQQQQQSTPNPAVFQLVDLGTDDEADDGMPAYNPPSPPQETTSLYVYFYILNHKT
jgi:hypothetical protein